ncbi:MAG: diguanylate cyclase [Fimbriimonadaceae bacterium]|nr:diguanylate cyclase [Fimbriimonadaceae bacterium]
MPVRIHIKGSKNYHVLSWKRNPEKSAGDRLTRYAVFLGSTVHALKLLVIAPKESKSVEFAGDLDALQEKAKSLSHEDQFLRLAKSMGESAEVFANHQRESIEEIIGDLDQSLRDLVGSLDKALESGDKIARGANGMTRRLSSIDSISSFEELRQTVAQEVRVLADAVSEYRNCTAEIHEQYRAELEEMRARLESANAAARADSLTKLPNRTSHEYRLSEIVELARQGQTASLAVIDLDGFKLINDTYGHQAGDAALVEFTQLFYKTFGRDCSVARLGGDEFTIIAKQSAEQLTKRLEDFLIRALNTPLNIGPVMTAIGFSYGVAEITSASTCNRVTQEADERMYAFKREAKRQKAA